MAVWRYIFADPATGEEVGEAFQVSGKDVYVPLDGLRTAAGSISLDNPMADVILGAVDIPLARINLLLKTYRQLRDGSWWLPFVGPLVAAEESASEDGGRLDFSAASPFRRLNKRMVGKSTAGYGDGTPLAMKDLGEMAGNLITVTNAEADTGIRLGTLNPSSNSYVGPWYFKKIAEAILEMGPQTLGGYDFDFAPIEPAVDVDGLALAEFNTYAALGSIKDNAVYEFGTGRRNVTSYQRPISTDGELNQGHSLPQGFPDAIADGDGVVTRSDGPAIAARGLAEDVVTADLGVTTLREELVDENVRIRRQPRETWLFQPAANISPEFGTDVDVGDIVPARAVYQGVVRFDAYFRIYAARFQTDDMGNETPTVTLVNDT